MSTPVSKTPLGTLNWVYVDGDGRDQSEKNDGSKMQKMATLVLKTDSEECKNLMSEINSVWETYKGENKAIKAATEAKSLGYKVIKDRETDAPTEFTGFSFKTNSFFPDGKPNNVPIFSAGGGKLETGKCYRISNELYNCGADRIGNGSTGIIHYEAGGYEFKGAFGVSLYLKAVQLKSFKPAGVEIEVEDISGDEDECIEIVVGDGKQDPAGDVKL